MNDDEEDPYRYFDGVKFKCAHCGCELNDEVALVGDEEWCHPCADEHDATDKALQLDKDPPDAGETGTWPARS